MKQPESIILGFANVRNDNLKHLNPELQKIRDVLKDAEEKKYVNVIEHNGITYNSLSYLLHSEKGKAVTMLHFSGHSSRNGLWVQSHEESGVITKKPLSNLIKSHRKFRFVFLNSCFSREIAQELSDAGVPYVIGTSDMVNDSVAAVVAAKFYFLLAKAGKTIEEAFLLTKDYIDDPLNNDDVNIKEAFRTFAILDDSGNEYPWQLYQRHDLTEKDKHWVLIAGQSNRKRNKLYMGAAGAAAVIAIILFLLLNPEKFSGKTSHSAQAISDSSMLVGSVESTGSGMIFPGNGGTLPSVRKRDSGSSVAASKAGEAPTIKSKRVEPLEPNATVDKSGSSKEAGRLALLNGAYFDELSSTDNLSFTIASQNALNFSGKLAGYLISGKLQLLNNMNFKVIGSNVSGNLSFINNEDELTGNVVIKETQLPHTVHLKRRKE